MTIIKNKKDINSKTKNKIKTIQIKEEIVSNLKKDYDKNYYINYYNNNYYEIFDALHIYNSTLNQLYNVELQQVISITNLLLFPIKNLPYQQIINYILYRLFKQKKVLKPISHNNFIYNSCDNIIEIDFEKYENQSYDIIINFLKPRILDALNYKMSNVSSNSLNNMCIFIFHNFHCLASNTKLLLDSLIKKSFINNNIRYIISSNEYNLKKLGFHHISCCWFNINMLFQIYNYIYNKTDYEKILFYSDNQDNIINDKITLETYNSYSVNIESHNILQFLINIDYINYSNQNNLSNIRSKPILFEKKLYSILDIIMFNEEKLLIIIEKIKTYVQNIINYDVNYNLFIKLINIYIKNLIKKIINKDISYTIFLEFKRQLYKIFSKNDIKQKASNFTHDFIVYENVLLEIYKCNLKYKLYEYLRNYKTYQLLL